ncbi:flagellar type III secretion system pore protein FliP [Cysteiniphilum sp. QT6929]|uniref:flagellar type III secretion system pore protein FliP n=1 Tax=Cysteiniphilum sp. QT6929 TaxID=2975055 RepID=UPI0024B326B2|nr:flagellar type III secretion system pore protein FliP [Cysteiniphilum sp. QT6929]WHN66108.1 flagellar type III secretion system pore protein FliP [Cysteiniphilum sp. QT6929]
MKRYCLFIIAISFTLWSQHALANDLLQIPGLNLSLSSSASNHTQISTSLQIITLLTVLSLAPSILIMLTAFTRIVIVLSMLRHAFGLQQTPPNSVIISLSLFLTFFVMAPVFSQIYTQAAKPYLEEKLEAKPALDKAITPLRAFMIKQTQEDDMALILKLSHSAQPKTADDIPLYKLIPAFMLSELQTAFKIGFIIFLPFLLVDLLVAVILMSLGMVMLPPTTISLPIKILLFVLISGWDIVINALVGSFH